MLRTILRVTANLAMLKIISGVGTLVEVTQEVVDDTDASDESFASPLGNPRNWKALQDEGSFSELIMTILDESKWGNPIPPGVEQSGWKTPAVDTNEPEDEDDIMVLPPFLEDDPVSSIDREYDDSPGLSDIEDFHTMTKENAMNRLDALNTIGQDDEFDDILSELPPKCNTTCDDDAICKRIPGGEEGICVCKKGFDGIGLPGQCLDIDECAVSNKCDPAAICTNIPGSFKCQCIDGYTGNGCICHKIQTTNECTTNRYSCDSKAECLDLVMGYMCICHRGYTGEGKPGMCTDMNECNDLSNKCNQKHGICKNTAGSYTCTCSRGYQGDGIECAVEKRNISSMDPLASRMQKKCHSDEIGYNFETDITRSGHAMGLIGEDGKPVPVSNEGRLKLAWTIENNRISAKVIFPFVAGWVAFGFSDRENSMINSNVLMGQVDDRYVAELNLTKHDANGVYVVPQGDMTFNEGTVLHMDKKTILTFSRSLEHHPIINPDGKTFLIYAYGPGEFTQHTPTNRGSTEIIFNQCELLDTTRNVKAKQIIHGVLMFAGPGLAAPCGAMVARFLKVFSIKNNFPALWFHLHWSLQVLAISLVIGGFIMSFDLVPKEREFTKAHHIIGIFIVAVFFFQPVFAIFRPAKYSSAKTIPTMRKLWEFLHMNLGRVAIIASLVNIPLGLCEAHATKALTIIYYIYLGLLTFLFFLCILYFRKQKSKGRQPFFTRTSITSASSNEADTKLLAPKLKDWKKDGVDVSSMAKGASENV